MLAGMLFATIAIVLVAGLSLAIPIVIGVLVYRDAQKRVDCNPVLWCLVAALVPSFIGLIVYLIIRGDYPLKDPNAPEHPNVDPKVQEARAQYYEEKETSEKEGFPTWAKVLIGVGIAMVALFIAACIAIFVYAIRTDAGAMTSPYDVEIFAPYFQRFFW